MNAITKVHLKTRELVLASVAAFVLNRVSVHRRDIQRMQRSLQHGSFSSVSQPLVVWSVRCPLNMFPVQADDDGSGGWIASWVASTEARPILGIPGSLAVAWMDGRSPDARPVGCREQVLGTDLRSSAVPTLSLLLPTFPHEAHTNFLYSESANRMFRLRNKKCSETGPNRRCSGPKQYQNQFGVTVYRSLPTSSCTGVINFKKWSSFLPTFYLVWSCRLRALWSYTVWGADIATLLAFSLVTSLICF